MQIGDIRDISKSPHCETFHSQSSLGLFFLLHYTQVHRHTQQCALAYCTILVFQDFFFYFFYFVVSIKMLTNMINKYRIFLICDTIKTYDLPEKTFAYILSNSGLIFRFSKKAKNFEAISQQINQVGDCFKFLLPFQNVRAQFQKLMVYLAVLLVYKTWSKMNAKVRSWHSNSNVFIFPLYPSQAGAPQSSGIQCRAKLISKHKCQDDWMKLVTTGSSQI